MMPSSFASQVSDAFVIKKYNKHGHSSCCDRMNQDSNGARERALPVARTPPDHFKVTYVRSTPYDLDLLPAAAPSAKFSYEYVSL